MKTSCRSADTYRLMVDRLPLKRRSTCDWWYWDCNAIDGVCGNPATEMRCVPGYRRGWRRKPSAEPKTSPALAPGAEDLVHWKTMALECLGALRLIAEHYHDLSRSNPGFMAKLCLQNYALWNDALVAVNNALRKYGKSG